MKGGAYGQYDTVYRGGTGEYTEKKSDLSQKFILFPVKKRRLLIWKK